MSGIVGIKHLEWQGSVSNGRDWWMLSALLSPLQCYKTLSPMVEIWWVLIVLRSPLWCYIN